MRSVFYGFLATSFNFISIVRHTHTHTPHPAFSQSHECQCPGCDANSAKLMPRPSAAPDNALCVCADAEDSGD